MTGILGGGNFDGAPRPSTSLLTLFINCSSGTFKCAINLFPWNVRRLVEKQEDLNCMCNSREWNALSAGPEFRTLVSPTVRTFVKVIPQTVTPNKKFRLKCSSKVTNKVVPYFVYIPHIVVKPNP